MIKYRGFRVEVTESAANLYATEIGRLGERDIIYSFDNLKKAKNFIDENHNYNRVDYSYHMIIPQI